MTFDLGTPVDERYPGDMALASIALMEGARPGLVMRNASPETVLIEALSLAAADVANAANATVSAYVELLLSRFFQVPRRPGVPAVGEVTVTFDDTVSTTIPAGTGFVLTDYGVEVATTADVTVAAATSVALQVATAAPTSLVNGVGPGAGVDILDVIPNALSVALTSAMANGSDPEDSGAYLARAQYHLQLLSRALGRPSTFEAYVRLDGRATNALAIASWDGDGSPPLFGMGGIDGGHVTVVTYGKGGALSPEVRAELAAAMQERCLVGVTVHVIDALEEVVNVSVSVKGMPGYSAGDVESAVGVVVRDFLNGETWPIGTDMIRNQLQDRITAIPQVDYVESFTSPSADVPLSPVEVAVAGTITVSVT